VQHTAPNIRSLGPNLGFARLMAGIFLVRAQRTEAAHIDVFPLTDRSFVLSNGKARQKNPPAGLEPA
jgi:hypothetical protein